METELAVKPEFKAMVAGKEYTQVPDDLFIPPDALEVLLDSFSGPLDLLLYLIRKQNLDILDIPMVSITQQYLQYIELMQYQKLELAADYLLMAAVLAEIKSRMLLPITPSSEEETDEDPRMALVRRLQAYEQMKHAAELLDALPRRDRDYFLVEVNPDEIETIKVHPEVDLAELIEAMKGLLQKEMNFSKHEIAREVMTVRERMSNILLRIQEESAVEFTQLFDLKEGRMGLVVTMLAILELARQSLLVITQNQPFSPIHIKAA
ncbi:MAG: segregation/condensation protein A [Legionella sp.]|nr:MAG: segregation/condensation protein A [Legionella sp.]